jgi:hypothetical protein
MAPLKGRLAAITEHPGSIWSPRADPPNSAGGKPFVTLSPGGWRRRREGCTTCNPPTPAVLTTGRGRPLESPCSDRGGSAVDASRTSPRPKLTDQWINRLTFAIDWADDSAVPCQHAPGKAPAPRR